MGGRGGRVGVQVVLELEGKGLEEVKALRAEVRRQGVEWNG